MKVLHNVYLCRYPEETQPSYYSCTYRTCEYILIKGDATLKVNKKGIDKKHK